MSYLDQMSLVIQLQPGATSFKTDRQVAILGGDLDDGSSRAKVDGQVG